jgi:hypothetical protein
MEYPVKMSRLWLGHDSLEGTHGRDDSWEYKDKMSTCSE